MSIFGSIKETIKRYGNSVTIVEGDKKYSVTAFVEPLRYKNRVYVLSLIHISEPTRPY